jgi:hypothetical protein
VIADILAQAPPEYWPPHSPNAILNSTQDED